MLPVNQAHVHPLHAAQILPGNTCTWAISNSILDDVSWPKVHAFRAVARAAAAAAEHAGRALTTPSTLHTEAAAFACLLAAAEASMSLSGLPSDEETAWHTDMGDYAWSSLPAHLEWGFQIGVFLDTMLPSHVIAHRIAWWFAQRSVPSSLRVAAAAWKVALAMSMLAALGIIAWHMLAWFAGVTGSWRIALIAVGLAASIGAAAAWVMAMQHPFVPYGTRAHTVAATSATGTWFAYKSTQGRHAWILHKFEQVLSQPARAGYTRCRAVTIPRQGMAQLRAEARRLAVEPGAGLPQLRAALGMATVAGSSGGPPASVPGQVYSAEACPALSAWHVPRWNWDAEATLHGWRVFHVAHATKRR